MYLFQKNYVVVFLKNLEKLRDLVFKEKILSIK